MDARWYRVGGDGRIGQTPWWWPETITSYKRPGQGVGGGRPRKGQQRAQGRPAQLRFHRWDGTGRVAVQLQRGAAHPPRTPETMPAQRPRSCDTVRSGSAAIPASVTMPAQRPRSCDIAGIGRMPDTIEDRDNASAAAS